MPVTAEELVRVLAMLAEEEKLRVTVKESLKGGAMAGTGAVIGGFMGGPVGIAIGGIMGSVTGAWMTAGKFRPVHEILQEMDPRKREELYGAFQNILYGGLAGHMTARWYGRGKFRDVSDIVTQLDKEKREELHQQYYTLLQDHDQEDAYSLNRKLAVDGELREKMLGILKLFLKDNLKENLVDNHVERVKQINTSGTSVE